nr:hypothetical protein [Candidatus Cloacimonadota bacterium]
MDDASYTQRRSHTDCTDFTDFDLIPEIYTSRRVTHESATAVFSDQKFPALQQELDGRICCSEKT